jgi:hypothetical protein
MKLTKQKLKQIIKEEMSKVLREGMMDRPTEITDMLRTIHYWMEDNGIYSPKDGVTQWIAAAREAGQEIDEETEKALHDMSDEIYEYME